MYQTAIFSRCSLEVKTVLVTVRGGDHYNKSCFLRDGRLKQFPRKLEIIYLYMLKLKSIINITYDFESRDDDPKFKDDL